MTSKRMIRRVVLNRFKDYERSSIIIFPKVSNALYYADQDRSIKLDRNLLSISSLVNDDSATDKNERVPAQNSPIRGREPSHHDRDDFRTQQSDNSRHSGHRSSTPSHIRDGRRSLSPLRRRKYDEAQTSRSASHRDVQTSWSESHRNVQISRSESHRDVQTNRSESHRDVQTSRSESHRDVQTGRSESHRDVQTGRSESHRDVQTSRSASHRDVRSRPVIFLDDRDRGYSSHRDDHGIRSTSHRDHVSRSAILLDDRDSGPLSHPDDRDIISIAHRDDVSRSTILLDDLSRSLHPDDRDIRSIAHHDDRDIRSITHHDDRDIRSITHHDDRDIRSITHHDDRDIRSITHHDDRDIRSITHHDDRDIRSIAHHDDRDIRSIAHHDDRDIRSIAHHDDRDIRSIAHHDDRDIRSITHHDDRDIRSIAHHDDRLSLLRDDRDIGPSLHQDDRDDRSSQQLQIHSRRLESSTTKSDNERRIVVKNLPLFVRAPSLTKYIKNAKFISVHQDVLKTNSLIGIIEFYTAKEAVVFRKENNHMQLFKRTLILKPYADGIGIGPAIGRPTQDQSPSQQDLSNSPSRGISRQQSRSPLLRNQKPQTHSVPSDRYIDKFLQEHHEKLSDRQSTSQGKDIFNQFKDHAKKFATENPDSARALNELLVALGHTSKPNQDPSPLDDLQKAFIPQNKLSADAWAKGNLNDMSPDSRRNFEREHISDLPKLAVLDKVEDLSQNMRILSQLSKLAKHLKTDRYDSDDAAVMALSTLEKLTSQTNPDPLPDDSRKSPCYPCENRDINDRFSQSPADNYYGSAETSSLQKCISFDYNHQKPGNEMKRRSSSRSPYRKEDRSQDRYDDSPDYKKRSHGDYESDSPSRHRARHDLRRRDDPRDHFDESLPNDWYEDRGWREESRRSRDELREYSPMDEYERDRFLRDDDARLNQMREMHRRDGHYDDDDDSKRRPYYDRQIDPEDDKPVGWRYYSMRVKGGKQKQK